MEDKSEETVKTEDIRTEMQDQNRSLGRPKSFCLHRRNEVYYFSDESERGILKRVPIKNGLYEINELETVLEKSGAAKTPKEIFSDVPLNSPGISKDKQNSSASKNDILGKSAYHKQKSENVLKSSEKVDGYMQQSQTLNKVEGLGAPKNDLKVKDEYQDPMTADNRTQKENIFLKSSEGIERQQSNDGGETDYRDLHGSESDEKYKKFSASNMKHNSPKKPEEFESNNDLLVDRWSKKRFSDELSKILMKTTPITEL